MTKFDKEEKIKRAVRERYSKIARAESSGCCGGSCCGSTAAASKSCELGYSAEDIARLPAGADMGLGSGNPVAIADLMPGETVLDLGCGGGIDCFLAALKVGDDGRVIGVDMTPEMIERARENARNGGFENVEFRRGEIEQLPVADASADVVVSNCVINLSADKPAVYREIMRVLKPGGRLAVSDVVARRPLPDEMKEDPDMLCGCISGAADIGAIEKMLAEAGFADIEIIPDDDSESFIREWAPGSGVEKYVTAAAIKAVKPDR